MIGERLVTLGGGVMDHWIGALQQLYMYCTFSQTVYINGTETIHFKLHTILLEQIDQRIGSIIGLFSFQT